MCVVRQAHKSTVAIFQKKISQVIAKLASENIKNDRMLIGMSTLKSVSGLL